MNNKYSPGLHDLVQCGKRSAWILPIGLIVFLLLIPFSTAGLPGDSIYNIEVTHEQMKFRLFHPGVTLVLIGAALALGLCVGLIMFHFVQSKKETTIYFTLGISRIRLFINRSLIGACTVVISIALPMLVSVLLNINALGNYQGLIRNSIYISAGLIVTSLVSFFVAAAVTFAAGTAAETVVYWVGIMFGPTVICYGIGLLLNKLYWGNPWGVITYSGVQEIKSSVMENFSFLNPITFFRRELETHGMFSRSLTSATPEQISGSRLILWAVICVILAILAAILISRRKAENAGIAGTSTVLSEYIIVITGFLAFAVVFAFLYDFSVILAAALGILAFLAVHLFWRKTLFSRRSAGLQITVSLGAQVVVIGFVCLMFASGFFGQTERFLEKGNIKEAKLTYVGAPSLLYGEATGSSTGSGYYFMSTISLSGDEALSQVKSLQKMFTESGRLDLGSSENAEDMVIPYDVCFTYIDENNKEHTWYYDRATFAQLENMLAIEEQKEVKEARELLFSGNLNSENIIWNERAYSSYDIYLTDSFLNNTYQLTMTDEDRKALLEALAADVSSMTVEQLYFPEETARAVLMFTNNGEQDTKYFTYHLDNSYVYVTDDHVQTLAWLSDNGLLELVQETPEIEYMYLQKFDPYIGINGMSYPMGLYFMAYCGDTDNEFLIQKDFGRKKTISDESEIQAIAEVLQDGFYMSRGGYLAAVKLVDDDRYRYMFLPADKVPDFIRN